MGYVWMMSSTSASRGYLLVGLASLFALACGSSHSATNATAAGGANGGATTSVSAANGQSTAGSGVTNGAGGANPQDIARVSGWLTNPTSGLPNYAYTNIAKNFP